MRTHLAVFALLASLHTPASAEVIPVTFVGEITGVHEALGDAFTVGAPATGSFSLDTASPDLQPGPDEGDYAAIADLEVEIDGYVATAAAASLFIRNGSGLTVDNFYVTSHPAGADVAGLPLEAFYVELQDVQNTLFTSDAIPAALPLAELENRAARLFFQDGGFSRSVDVEITELQYGAPEPGPPLLTAIGALALAAARRAGRTR
jgi:hypothetical protein